MLNLREHFGAIDIYLFDQLLRGAIEPGMRIFDAGCGSGRNLVYLMRAGYDVSGVDRDPRNIDEVRRLAAQLAPALPAENFRTEPIEENTFPSSSADYVIASAVLHFARDTTHFLAMVDAMWRVMRPGGILFARLATAIGIGHLFGYQGPGRYRLPDGSDRFVVDDQELVRLTERLRGRMLDPLKTTVVDNQRSMTTWVVQKS